MGFCIHGVSVDAGAKKRRCCRGLEERMVWYQVRETARAETRMSWGGVERRMASRSSKVANTSSAVVILVSGAVGYRYDSGYMIVKASIESTNGRRWGAAGVVNYHWRLGSSNKRSSNILIYICIYPRSQKLARERIF